MHTQFHPALSFTRTIIAAAAMFCLAVQMLPAQNNWTRVQTPSTENLLSVDFPTAMIGYASGDNGTLVKTTDGGATWTSQTHPFSGNIWVVRFSSATNGLAAGDNGTIIRTTDGGATWTAVASGLKNGALSSFIFGLFYQSPEIVFAAGGDGEAMTAVVLKSTDAGVTWQKTPIAGWLFVDKVIFMNAQHGYAVGASLSGNRIAVTTDGGATWQTTSSGTTLAVTSVAPLDHLKAIAVGAGSMMYTTTNGGASWTQTTSPVSADLMDIAFHDMNEGVVVGSDGTVLSTMDGGAAWTSSTIEGGGLLTDVMYLPGTKDLVTVGAGGAVYKRTGAVQAGVAGEARPVRAEITPNPMRDMATLRLDAVHGIAEARASVFDMLGRRVLDEAVRPHTPLAIERGSLAAGRYIYVVRAGEKIIARGTLIVE